MSRSPWEHFTWKELTCRCGCGRADMDPIFMSRVVTLRLLVARKFVVTSAYRCPDYNERVSRSKSRTGPHTTGHAMDVAADGALVWAILPHLAALGFTGVGLQQKGGDRYIHFDDLNGMHDQSGNNLIRPWVWTY